MKRIKRYILIGLLMCVVCMMFWGSGRMLYLNHYGLKTTGYLQSVFKAGSKGQYHCRYTYVIDQKKYSKTEAYGM